MTNLSKVQEETVIGLEVGAFVQAALWTGTHIEMGR